MTDLIDWPLYDDFERISMNSYFRKDLSDFAQQEAFEQEAALYFGSKRAIAVDDFTTSIFLCLKAAGVKAGDEVVCGVVGPTEAALAIYWTQAKPVFCDVVVPSLRVNLAELMEKVTEKTKAVLVFHNNGYPENVMEIRRMVGHEVKIIEVVKEAHGSRFDVKLAGSMGDFGCVSLGNTTLMPAQSGAVILFNTEKDPIDKALGWEMRDNFKLSRLQTLIASTQLMKLNSMVLAARGKANEFKEALGGSSPQDFKVEFVVERDGEFGNGHTVVVLLPRESTSKVLIQLNNSGVKATALRNYKLTELPFWRHEDHGEFQVADEAFKTMICIGDESNPLFAQRISIAAAWGSCLSFIVDGRGLRL